MGKANRGAPMNNIYTAVIKKDGDWWIGWIEEVPGVNCQEKSRKELLESLKVTLKEALEFNRNEAISSAGQNFKEEKIAIWNAMNISKDLGIPSVKLWEEDSRRIRSPFENWPSFRRKITIFKVLSAMIETIMTLFKAKSTCKEKSPIYPSYISELIRSWIMSK